MRNLHLIILQEFGIEARRLLREWERLQLRSSDYKNHRIFSLSCIHKELIPVSIKLKSTLDTPKGQTNYQKSRKRFITSQDKSYQQHLSSSRKGNTRLQGQASFNHLTRKVRTMPTFHQ